MKPINAVLDNFLKKTRLSDGINQQKAVEVWPEIVGNKIAENADAVSVEHGVLFIRAGSSAWSQELQLKKKEILLKINKKVGKRIIKDMRFI